MKLSKLFLAIGGIFFSVLSILYGCKKYDESFPDRSQKGYSYFKSSMSGDENIQGMYSGLNQVKWLMAYRSYANNKLSTSRNAPVLNRSVLQLKAKQLLEQAKGLKTETQLLAFQSTLGFGSDGASIVNELKNQREHFQHFVQENPEFKTLSTDQQKELLLNAMKQIKIDHKNTLLPTQEKTASECQAKCEEDENDAERDWYIELVVINSALVACIAVSEGTALSLCYEGWTYATAAAEVHYWLQMTAATVSYNECMAAVPTSSRSL